jgi:hypothetical protein
MGVGHTYSGVWCGMRRLGLLTAIAGIACDRSAIGGDTTPDAQTILVGASAEEALACWGRQIWSTPSAPNPAPGAAEWGLRFGGPGTDEGHGVGVAPDGSVVVGSTLWTQIALADGTTTVTSCGYLSRIDASGRPLWTRSVGARVGGLVVSPAGDIVAIVWDAIARFSPDGAARWVRPTPGATQVSSAPDDGVVVVRSGRQVADGISVYDTSRIEKLTAVGERAWIHTLETQTIATAVSAEGDVFAAFPFSSTETFLGRSFTAVGVSDLLVVKLAEAGTPQWMRQFGSPANESVSTATAIAGGGVVLSGVAGADLDFGGGPLGDGTGMVDFMVKLDAAGNWSASRVSTLPPAGWARVAGLPSGAVLRAENFVGRELVEGTTLHTGSDRDADFGLVEYSPALAPGRIWHFGNGGGNQTVTGLAVDPAGGVVVTGSFEGHLEIGSDDLVSAGALDVFVARVQP